MIKEKKDENREMLPMDVLELFNDDILVLEDSKSVYGGVESGSNVGCNYNCGNNCGS